MNIWQANISRRSTPLFASCIPYLSPPRTNCPHQFRRLLPLSLQELFKYEAFEGYGDGYGGFGGYGGYGGYGGRRLEIAADDPVRELGGP